MRRHFIALFDYEAAVQDSSYPVDDATLDCFRRFETELHWMNWIMVF